VDQAYREERTQHSEHRPINPNVVWLLVCGTLTVAGYLYGLHNGSTTYTLQPPSPRAEYRAPSHADNTLPIAPNLGDNGAPGDLLARARLENELLYTDLQSFICSERMDRYQGRLDGDKLRQIDTVNAQVSFENGVETYSDIHQDQRQRTSLSSLPGAWSEGEFGTLLRQTRALLATQPISVTEADANGTPATLYRFYVAANDSPWDLTVSSRQYRVPFRTDVWVSKSSGQIIKIARNTTGTPPGSGISEIRWDVSLKPVNLDGKTWLLPSTGEYSVLYENLKRREWNEISFSDYHRYASQSVIHF
jgi:hypothetical protein